MSEPSSRTHFPGWAEAQDYYFDEELTDGLPIVPPTPERVEAMLDYCGLAAGHVLGTEGIRHKSFLAEKVAANAVMAGCLPEYFPAVVAAVSAISERSYNLHASSTSTNGITNLALVSGPYAAQIGMNDGVGLMGNGNRANATIGRAINLVKSNYYGSVAGDMDKSTFGHSGKFSFCFAENLRVSPWASLAEHKGFQRGGSTVTMIAANAPLQFECHGDNEPEGFLTAAAHALMGLGPSLAEIVLVISPELMAHIVASGWTREQVQAFCSRELPTDRRGLGPLAAHGQIAVRRGLRPRHWFRGRAGPHHRCPGRRRRGGVHGRHFGMGQQPLRHQGNHRSRPRFRLDTHGG